MKLAQFLFVILFSLNSLLSLAQTQHGGGGPDGDGLRLPPGMNAKEFKRMNELYQNAIQKLNDAWKKCVNKHEADFEDLNFIYLQLYWREAFVPERKIQCEMRQLERLPEKNVVNCIFDKETSKQIRDFFVENESILYIQFVEGKDHAEEKIKFFRKHVGVKKP
jgi:hypothetical protein